ncbi:MAG TPA: SPFH domain-containing protein [Byssovorax sp.]|jgi:hypothetical protein
MRTRHLVALAVALVLSGCASVTTSIAPGHRAVVTAADGGTSVIGEGAADVPADAQVEDFDLREESQGGTFAARTADGVPVLVRDPVLTYTWVADELPAAAREVGAARRREIAAAIVASAVSAELAKVRYRELDPARLRALQAEVTRVAAARLRPYHVALDGVELKGVTPRLPGLARAVTDTSVWEQRALEAKSGVELAKQRADRARAEAAGVAKANATLASSLTPGVLGAARNDAWKKLLTAKTTTVDVARSTTLEINP